MVYISSFAGQIEPHHKLYLKPTDEQHYYINIPGYDDKRPLHDETRYYRNLQETGPETIASSNLLNGHVNKQVASPVARQSVASSLWQPVPPLFSPSANSTIGQPVTRNRIQIHTRNSLKMLVFFFQARAVQQRPNHQETLLELLRPTQPPSHPATQPPTHPSMAALIVVLFCGFRFL